MTGLMTFLGRHSRFMTNFKIYYPESRPISLGGRYAECEEPGVRRASGGGLECPVDADNGDMAWVGPWQYQITGTGWVLGSTRCSTLPVPTLLAPPRVYPSPTDMLVPGTNTVYWTPGTCTYDRFRCTVGDPRGGIRTGTHGRVRSGHSRPVPGPPHTPPLQ